MMMRTPLVHVFVCRLAFVPITLSYTHDSAMLEVPLPTQVNIGRLSVASHKGA